MKLVMTLLVRNEEDILAANLDFHRAQGVDFFIVTDNGSIDGTVSILSRYEGEGILKVIHEPDDDYSQAVWVTRMARMAHTEFGADWVVNNDADEFWTGRKGTLTSALASVPEGVGQLEVRRFNFVTIEGTEPFWKRMRIRDERSVNSHGWPLPPKICHRGSRSVEVSQGNHDAAGVEGERRTTDDVEILHFPVRSYEQLATKIKFGGAAYARNAKLDRSVGCTWRSMYERYQRGELEGDYRRQVPSDEGIAAMLATGRFSRDDRLFTFMQERLSRETGCTCHIGSTRTFSC